MTALAILCGVVLLAFFGRFFVALRRERRTGPKHAAIVEIVKIVRATEDERVALPQHQKSA
jgi:hypothetical protein